jgi:hypothetical protein
MVKPIKMQRVTKPKSLDFEGMIQAGQHPGGFTAQTPNGTAKYGNQPGWNKDYKFGTQPQVAPEGAWSNANRTGE